MKKFLMVLCAVMLVFCVTGSASADFFIDFEDGVEGGEINDITGVTFEDAFGYTSRYGDSRTNNYNTTSDDMNQSWNSGNWHHNGYMWLWAGPDASAQGVTIDFTNNDGTWFETGYSSSSTFYVDAYLTDGTMVNVTGAANTGGPMGYLTVTATTGLFIDYIVLYDTGNQWLVDDMSGNASDVNTPVPEPSTILLMSAGLLGLVGYNRKRFSKKS